MKQFLILLITVFLPTCYSGCPSMCSCTDSSVLCVEKDLEHIPNLEVLGSHPIIVDLSGNKINFVSNNDFSFDNNDMIKEVYLNNSEVVEIEDEAFEELDNLQELYLGQNLLNKINENIIEPLENVVLLEISNNYFIGDMPTIRSKSLEVLAIANSKITNVPKNALKFLPNLKMLLLQQNNVKNMNMNVFREVQEMSFFVKLSYNTWDCSCSNIKLFQYLSSKNFVDTAEPYQCISQNSTFVKIFDKDGVASELHEKCYVSAETRQLVEDTSNPISKRSKTVVKQEVECVEISVPGTKLYGFKLSDFLICVCCFFVGFLLGFGIPLLAGKIRSYKMEKPSESRTKLLLP